MGYWLTILDYVKNREGYSHIRDNISNFAKYALILPKITPIFYIFIIISTLPLNIDYQVQSKQNKRFHYIVFIKNKKIVS